jgi:hypothetical protein
VVATSALVLTTTSTTPPVPRGATKLGIDGDDRDGAEARKQKLVRVIPSPAAASKAPPFSTARDPEPRAVFTVRNSPLITNGEVVIHPRARGGGRGLDPGAPAATIHRAGDSDDGLVGWSVGSPRRTGEGGQVERRRTGLEVALLEEVEGAGRCWAAGRRFQPSRSAAARPFRCLQTKSNTPMLLSFTLSLSSLTLKCVCDSTV